MSETELTNCLDLIHDIKSDLEHIKSFDELKEDMPFLLSWCKQIEETLRKYKDIEDELGIDLITLFKGVINGVYYKYGDRIQLWNCVLDKAFDWDKNMYVPMFHISLGVVSTYVKLYDYGKTWALTKEELENE